MRRLFFYFDGGWGPTFGFFKSLDNNMVYSLGIYPGTIKLSDAKVKRQGYKHALFGGGGGNFCVGQFFKNTIVHSDL